MIDLIGKSRIFISISFFLISFGILISVFFGFKVSVEYTGGTQVEVENFTVPELENFLRENYSNDLRSFEVLEKKGVINLSLIENEEVFSFKNRLLESFPDIYVSKVETVDPSFGMNFVRNSGIAILLGLIAMTLYISYSFRNTQMINSSWYFGISAIVALLHDIFFVIAAFGILGFFFGIRIDGLFLTAVLTIIGFSVNDTIVVFDRIRENLSKIGEESIEKICTLSIWETMNRSIITSFTVVVVMLSLFLFSTESIKYFSLAIVIGVISGTYSSVFIATPVLIYLNKLSIGKK